MALAAALSLPDIDPALIASLDVDRDECTADAFSSDASVDLSRDGAEADLPDEFRRGSHALGVLKRAWRAEEDEKLLALIKEHGPRRWGVIASSLPGRVGKQCRER
jgi:hypothetical protein